MREDELHGLVNPPEAHAAVEIGRVGWASSTEESHVDRGEPDHPDPAHRCTLVRVTLLRGGNEIYARISGGLSRIPPKGTVVYLIVPHGLGPSAGAPLIIATLEEDRRDNLSKGEVSLQASEGVARVLTKNDGTVTLVTTTDNTPDGKVIVFSISPTGWKFTAPWGSFVFDASGFHLRTAAGPRIDMGGISIPGLPDEVTGAFAGYCKITAPTIKCDGGSVFLGAGKVHNPCHHKTINPSFPPPIDVSTSSQSQTVYVAP